jgi:hypothetical protein
VAQDPAADDVQVLVEFGVGYEHPFRIEPRLDLICGEDFFHL